MEKYDYLANVIADVKEVVTSDYNYIEELKEDREAFEDKLNDELWTNDSVTGNGSGSYTFNTWQAEENLCHNFDILKTALDEFGSNIDILDNAEACDVTIRCYLLAQAISIVLDSLESELQGEE